MCKFKVQIQKVDGNHTTDGCRAEAPYGAFHTDIVGVYLSVWVCRRCSIAVDYLK